MWEPMYAPPFHDADVNDIARARGVIGADECIADGIQRVWSVLVATDRDLSGRPNGDFADELGQALEAGRVCTSSQLLTAACRQPTVAASTVLAAPGRTDEARLDVLLRELEECSAMGMGCGVDLSEFSDPARALERINDAVRAVQDRLVAQRSRPPALMVSCAASHPRVTEFVQAKWDSDLSSWTANISVKFHSEAEWASLRSVVAEGAHRNGEPGILFDDVAEADNPTPWLTCTSTAPCADVFLSPGERCVFLSVNIAAHLRGRDFEWDAFDSSIRLAVRAGDAAVELATFKADQVVRARRRMGIGICGLHTALITMLIPYAQSVPFARQVAERLTFAAHFASAQLAAERGPFPMYYGSRWQDPRWLRRKAGARCGHLSDEDWEALYGRISASGMRNASLVAHPPTGVIAELLGVSRSYEPHYSLVGRTGIASTKKPTLVPEVVRILAEQGLSGKWLAATINESSDYQLPDAGPGHILACARQLPATVHLAVHQAFSAFADEAGSKTVNVRQETSVPDVLALFDTARAAGLKGLTIFRDGCLSELRSDRLSRITR